MLLHLFLFAQETISVGVDLKLSGIIALLAGILILVRPRILNYVVATYLIVTGLIQIFNLQI